jgi:hypothetical protein
MIDTKCPLSGHDPGDLAASDGLPDVAAFQPSAPRYT